MLTFTWMLRDNECADVYERKVPVLNNSDIREK